MHICIVDFMYMDRYKDVPQLHSNRKVRYLCYHGSYVQGFQPYPCSYNPLLTKVLYTKNNLYCL